jgi:hypothetical protein
MLCVVVLGGGNSAAFAVSGQSIDNTPVLQDLANSTINGEPFDAADYPYNENGKAKLLALTEFCFSYKASLAGNYALYVYVYNPTGKEIRQDKNSLQIADVYANGKATHYKKYELKLCNSSTGGLDRLFYKFRVMDDGSIFERVCKDNTARRYDVSGIELNYTGTAEDFTVGNKWIYSGFAKGCGADENADSTLSCTTDDLETVRLNVSSTYYRYNNGFNKQTQVSSVYFGVSNELLQKYGTLQKIHAEWLKARTSEIAVITENNVYSNFENYIGVDVSEKDFNYCLFAHPSSDGEFSGWRYNVEIQNTVYDGSKRTDKLTYLFEKTGTDNTVSSEELQEYIKWYSEKFGNKTVSGKYSADLFSQVDANKTDVTIDADSTFDISGFNSGSGLLNWFYGSVVGNVSTEELKNIKPIKIIEETDLKGADEEIASRLLVAVADVDDIKAEFDANSKANKATVLFRFATSEYVRATMQHHNSTYILEPVFLPTAGYLAQETVYLDFDIIDLTFVKNDVATVIPVVSNPIDVIAGVTPPPSTSTDNNPPWWVWLLLLGVVVLILIAVLKFLTVPITAAIEAFFKLLWRSIVFVVTAPFRLIIWLCKKIFNRGSK